MKRIERKHLVKSLALSSVFAILAASAWAFQTCETEYPKCPPPDTPYTCSARPDHSMYDVAPSFMLLVCNGPARPECGVELSGCNELQAYESEARIYHCGTVDTFCITALGSGPTPTGWTCSRPPALCDDATDPVLDPILDPNPLPGGHVPTPLP